MYYKTPRKAEGSSHKFPLIGNKNNATIQLLNFQEFGFALKKRIAYKQIPYDTALTQYLEQGHEEWQGDALMEYYRGIDSGAEWANRKDISDFTTITGERPTSIKIWCEAMAANVKHLRYYGQHRSRGYRPYRGYRHYSVATTLSHTKARSYTKP